MTMSSVIMCCVIVLIFHHPQSPTLIHQSNPLNPPHPHSPQPTYRLTHPHLSNPICALCKTHSHTKEHLFNCTHLYTSKQHTGPLDVSREGGASATQVERTPGRATLTYYVVGPLHAGGVGRQQQQDSYPQQHFEKII